jgi:hypothetical protein
MANLSRRIYNSQTLNIPGLGAVPVKNISISRERPMEPMMMIGVLKGGNQHQKGPETFKIDVKCFMTSALNVQSFKPLFQGTQNGTPTAISMTDGFSATAVLTSINIDSSVGEFVEMSLSFQGIGNPTISTSTATTVGVDMGTSLAATTVLDSSNVTSASVDPFGTTVKSIKYSFEMPVEPFFTYNSSSFVGTSTDIMSANSMTLIAKAPYKSSLSIEGTSLTQSIGLLRGGLITGPTVGGMSLNLTNAVLKSFSTSQTPGEIGAAFSASYEGTSSSFIDP